MYFFSFVLILFLTLNRMEITGLSHPALRTNSLCSDGPGPVVIQPVIVEFIRWPKIDSLKKDPKVEAPIKGEAPKEEVPIKEEVTLNDFGNVGGDCFYDYYA
ncbi:hypothetical protein JYU34_000555 [Plutella xylostella]|uniref:Uncharacterized protein n=1 Tax=Plutella xylostella TaxID=51655 RepID=A0ABQ7R806_PLUXY|nr:hypothetical protein JYU34_000555 [Plutella xylostella]